MFSNCFMELFLFLFISQCSISLNNLLIFRYLCRIYISQFLLYLFIPILLRIRLYRLFPNVWSMSNFRDAIARIPGVSLIQDGHCDGNNLV